MVAHRRRGSGSYTASHLWLSIDPSRSLTLRSTLRAGCVGSDTEEVTGSNPVAPTTVLAGQGPVSTERTALLMPCGRRLLPHRTQWSLGAGRHGTTPRPNDHPAWSPPPGPDPLVGTTPATCPGRPAGPMSTCSIPCSAPGPGPAPVFCATSTWSRTPTTSRSRGCTSAAGTTTSCAATWISTRR